MPFLSIGKRIFAQKSNRQFFLHRVRVEALQRRPEGQKDPGAMPMCFKIFKNR